jgi:tetratricopeptide (TPR) repeat protein
VKTNAFGDILGLAFSLIQQGDFASAHAAAETLLSDYGTHPDIASAVRQVADCYLAAKRGDQALILYEKLLERKPSLKEQNNAYAGIARTNILQGNEAAAQSMTELILNNYTDPNDAARAIIVIGEEYYLRAQDAKRHGHQEQARQDFLKSIALIECDVLGIVDIDPNGVLEPDTDTPEYPGLNDALESMTWYVLGLNYWQLGQWYPAADAFMRAIDADPRHEFAGSMHWLVSDCYEKLKRDGAVSVEEADPVIEWGYQTLFDRYPDSRDVEYAAIQLGKIHLARGEPVSACVYFNWFLDHTHADNGQIADIGRIMERMEGCTR